MDYDIAIIGAGCVGCAVAQRLAKYNIKIALIDKESDVSMGTTKANSGIIHQGYFTAKGSLKESLSLRGNDLFDEICPKIDVEYERCGAIFCATNKNELKTLKGELKKSLERNVKVKLITNKEKIKEIEPELSDNIIAILHFPTAGIIMPFELTIALAEHAVMNGIDLLLKYEVGFIKKTREYFKIHAIDGREITAKTIVNAAGLYSDKIAKMVGDNSFNIIPRKGEYILFDKDVIPLNKIIFPTPNVVSKGIVCSRTLHGNTFVGPNAVEINSKEDTSTTTKGLNEIIAGGKKLLRNLPLRKTINNFAGIRASTRTHDFIIKSSLKTPNFVIAAGIDSPGLSSSLAIAEKIEGILIQDCNYHFVEKNGYIPKRKEQIKYIDLNEEELKRKIKENPQWGQIVCRCELVSEAEIVEACHRPIPATNTDMIKRRLRPSMGRCHGGFCLPKVMKIISRERKIIYEQVTKSGANSQIVFKRTKNLGSEIFQGDAL